MLVPPDVARQIELMAWSTYAHADCGSIRLNDLIPAFFRSTTKGMSELFGLKLVRDIDT